MANRKGCLTNPYNLKEGDTQQLLALPVNASSLAAVAWFGSNLHCEGPQRLLPKWPIDVICALCPSLPITSAEAYFNNTWLALCLCSRVSFQREGEQCLHRFLSLPQALSSWIEPAPRDLLGCVCEVRKGTDNVQPHMGSVVGLWACDVSSEHLSRDMSLVGRNNCTDTSKSTQWVLPPV